MDPTQRFSGRVENYARYRPGYPDEVPDLLQDRCGLTEDPGDTLVRRIGLAYPPWLGALRQRDEHDHRHEKQKEEGHRRDEDPARNEQRLGAEPEHGVHGDLRRFGPCRVVEDRDLVPHPRGRVGAELVLELDGPAVRCLEPYGRVGKHVLRWSMALYVRRDVWSVTIPTARASVLTNVSLKRTSSSRRPSPTTDLVCAIGSGQRTRPLRSGHPRIG